MEEESYLELPDDTTNSLYPALFQCFTIILCGYVAGTFNVVSQNESKGIGTFVGTFALPSLIFLSLARLDFSVVNWTFLGAILLAKGIIFYSVMLVTLLISKPINLGRAGMFAIFCTQSNDFALGYPIISAIYSQTHPEYALYLYLMAPISLAILNPVAFVLMEIHKQKLNVQNQQPANQLTSELCKFKLLMEILKGIAFNPVLVMTVLGILGNILFKHHLSVYIEGLLQVFGQSFSASALFLLGLRMVGQVHRLRGPALLLPCVLIMVKLIVLPVAMREAVSALGAGANDSDTLSLSTYAFLYGTIPTAPAVFVFASLYQMEMDLMASSMVICTLLSAPMMFISAQLIAISRDYAAQIRRFRYSLSIASLVAAAWVLLVFAVTKKYKRVPHRLTACLLLSQMLFAVSVIWGGPTEPTTAPNWATTAQGALRVYSMLSCLLWTAMLSVGLLMLETRGPCLVLALWPALAGAAWLAPAAAAAVLAAAPLGARAEDAVRLCFLWFCLVVSAGCLIVYARRRRRARGSGEAAALVDSERPTEETAADGLGCYGTIAGSVSPSVNGCCAGDPACEGAPPAALADIEDLTHRNVCECPHGRACAYLDTLQSAADSLGLLPAEQTRGRGGQMLRHTALVIVLNLSMFISITYTTWSLLGRDESGIYVEMQFLDAAAAGGPGLLALALFGLDVDELLVPAVRVLKKRLFGAATVELPAAEELSFETRHVCDQFIAHHLQRCRDAIAKDTRWRMRLYRGVFRGSCLVRWLVAGGLAKDDAEATAYGRHLLDGRLIAHIADAHHFSNSPLLYTFK